MLSIVSLTTFAIPPEADDNPSELSSRKICYYGKKIPQRIGKKIKRKALEGDSIAAIFIADNLAFLEGFEKESSDYWLTLAEKNGNPFAYMYIALNLFRSQNQDDFSKGIFKLKISAEKGIIGAISWLASIYSGDEEFKAYKDDSLAAYWREREALAGNLFNLKKFVLDNPNKLTENQLLPWQQAFEFINTNSTKRKVLPMSSDAKWLVNIFKRNKQNITELLKQHDVVYSGYKYCKYNSLTRQKQF
jgi:hypothetical protein